MSIYDETDEPVHLWFELTYSSYMVLPRSLLQSMPVEWQKRFVACVEELRDAYSHLDDLPSDYTVLAKEHGKFISDPYKDYKRGRRAVPRKP